MNEAFQMLLSKLKPHAGHLVVVGRGDSKVLILGTPNAGNRLGFIHQASPLEHEVTAIETEHFAAIERDLLSRFQRYREDGYGNWLHAEYADVVRALEEYDAETGARVRSGILKLGDRAYVKGVGKGEIGGFAWTGHAERVAFFSERFGHTIIVPRSQVKPVLRAAQ